MSSWVWVRVDNLDFRISSRGNRAFSIITTTSWLGEGRLDWAEGGTPSSPPNLRVTSCLLGLCLIHAKLSEMEEVKPAR